MSIEEINEALDAIAQANVEKERDAAKSTILKVIRSTSALEQKWFIRTMLKVIELFCTPESELVFIFVKPNQSIHN